MSKEKIENLLESLADCTSANKRRILEEWEKSFVREIAESPSPVTHQATQAIELVKEYLPAIIEELISIFRLEISGTASHKEVEYFPEFRSKALLRELYTQDLVSCLVRLSTIILEFGEPLLKNNKDYLPETKNIYEILIIYFQEMLPRDAKNRIWQIQYPLLIDHYYRFLESNTRFLQDSSYQLKHITTLGNYAFAETGIPTGVYWSNDKSLIVISSYISEYHWSARYSTFPVIRRVCIYKSTDLSLVRVFDQIAYWINHIVIHPSNKFIIIACGARSGGNDYEGALWRWNLDSGECASIVSHNIAGSCCKEVDQGKKLW